MGKAYVGGLYDDEGYRREKRSLEDKLAHLVVPGVDAAMDSLWRFGITVAVCVHRYGYVTVYQSLLDELGMYIGLRHE